MRYSVVQAQAKILPTKRSEDVSADEDPGESSSEEKIGTSIDNNTRSVVEVEVD